MDDTMAEAKYARYHRNPELSDVTVRYNGKETRAHKVILAANSDFFQKVFEGGFKERDADEIELHGDDAESVTIMLASFYNASHSIIDMLNHDQQGEDPQKGHQKLLRLVRLHAIATKYLAPRLLHALQSVFKSTLYECTYEGNIAELAQAVYAATTSTSDELRMSFIRYVSTHLEKLKTNPHFKEMVEDVPDMAVELLYHISEIMDKRILGDWGSWSECSPNNDP